ncbi:MAG: DNA polymerase III subunit gamma/tau, partial [Actinobacteria bacterium]|nr:DNA polymerase III subunit gamma/tau [Actinomycetota bacterium]
DPTSLEDHVAYVSLYRKYRPQSFEEVVGQRHVTQTLANAITEDRLHHAYLFTGPRGTGKTSTARILAKAVNCEQGPTATPCQTCAHCVAITEGSSVDVIELDMASHGGVDDARELRDRALFAPASARRKVYILDEVHMASNAAFNALLKLIEEPPGHVMFAMATTEPNKIIPTIMSRVQRLDLRRVAAQEVGGHVRRLAELEGLSIEDAAVEAVTRAGDGSVRDTLSVLDQVRSFASDETVTADHVASVLGHTPAERVFGAVALIAAQDLAGLMVMVQELQRDGHDLRRFALDLVEHLRDLLVLAVAPDRPDLVDATEERRGQLGGQAALLTQESLARAIDLLAETIAEMRRGPARLPLELALTKLARPAAAGDLAALADRVARLEAGAASRSTPPQPAPADPEPAADTSQPATEERTATAPQPTPEPESRPAPEPPAETDEPDEPAPEPVPDEPPPAEEPASEPDEEPQTAAADASLEGLLSRWERVLDRLKERSRKLHAFYTPGIPVGLDEGTLLLRFPQAFHAEQASQPDNAEVFRSVVREVTGIEVGAVRVEVAVDDTDAGPVDEEPVIDQREAVEVREAEAVPDDTEPDEAAERAVALLRDELGAEPVDQG